MRKDTAKFLLEMGFCSKMLGYRYLVELITDAACGTDITPLKKVGYKYLAARYLTTPENVEKNIQNAIASVCERGNAARIYDVFGATIDADKGKPTNKQFIMTAAEKLSRCKAG